MALSQWDQQLLTPAQQQEVLKYQAQWATADEATRASLHSYVEGIRAKAGYSGGPDGSQYIPINTGGLPTVPNIPTYQDPFSGMAMDMFDDIRNAPAFEDPYANLITETLSKIQNRKFEYNPDTDPAYQAFKERALAAGDKAYSDNLGGLSAMTGGRPNSWAATVASQARNEYVLQSEMAVIDFEDRAYSRYQAEGQELYNFIGVLDSLSTKAYNQYRDKIQDKKDLFNMVMDLSDQHFQRYEFMVDQTWKQFDAERVLFMDALEQKDRAIRQALDRTNLLGYVDNEASVLLGVPTGTLSQAARERAEAMIDYIKKQEIDLNTYAKQKEIDYKYDLKLISARAATGGSGYNYSDYGNYVPSKDESKDIDSVVADFKALVSSPDFVSRTVDRRDENGKRLSDNSYRFNTVKDFVSQFYSKVEANGFGANSDIIGNIILDRLQSIPEFNQYFGATMPMYYDENGYVRTMEGR